MVNPPLPKPDASTPYPLYPDMKQFLLEIFRWWHGQTWGTRLALWRGFEFVGVDQFGNKYYEKKGGGRRWVTYNGPAEASAIPPGWYGWMQYKTDVPPSRDNYQPRDWEKPHTPNMTGTSQAYRPRGSLLSNNTERQRVTGDYEAWSPE